MSGLPSLLPQATEGRRERAGLLRPDPNHPGHTIDLATGIWPIAEWGTECGRGWASDARFQRGTEKIIKRTAHKRRPIHGGSYPD